MLKDAFSEFKEAKLEIKEGNNEIKDLPDEIVDTDGADELPDELSLDSLDNKAGEEQAEKKELSQDEINNLQQQAIKDGFRKIDCNEKLSDGEKGNLGEALMDQYYIGKGYNPIHSPRVTDLEHKSGQGIDGVYEKTNPDGTKSYVIADAKVNFSRLNKGLADGTNQMSDAWIDKRLDAAVGKEKADEIRDAYEDNPDSVSKEVYRFSYDDNGNSISQSDIHSVDNDGNLNNDGKVVQVFDKNGNEIPGGKNNA